MSDYPETDKVTAAKDATQPAGEFYEWLASQGVMFMHWREDLTDTRPTDPECGKRIRERREHRDRDQGEPLRRCYPDIRSDTDGVPYWKSHCLHWLDPEFPARGQEQQGACCCCGKGRTYEVTVKGFMPEPRSLERLLADWQGIDLDTVEQERRAMLAALREGQS